MAASMRTNVCRPCRLSKPLPARELLKKQFCHLSIHIRNNIATINTRVTFDVPRIFASHAGTEAHSSKPSSPSLYSFDSGPSSVIIPCAIFVMIRILDLFAAPKAPLAAPVVHLKRLCESCNYLLVCDFRFQGARQLIEAGCPIPAWNAFEKRDDIL